jgi:hypothetical protein
MPYPKIVQTPRYHIWTDALHARSLAQQANNKWDRGTYVRWCVSTSWTALEIACQDATSATDISYSFRRNLDGALSRLNLPRIDWGKGVWQKVIAFQETRKNYMHRFVSEADLFPRADVADGAIATTREAIIAIYTHVNRPVPPWSADDDDRGWDSGRKPTANLTAVHRGADQSDDETLYVRFVLNGREHTSDVLPPGTEWLSYCEGLLSCANFPIERIRVYRGAKLIHDEATNLRGA